MAQQRNINYITETHETTQVIDTFLSLLAIARKLRIKLLAQMTLDKAPINLLDYSY